MLGGTGGKGRECVTDRQRAGKVLGKASKEASRGWDINGTATGSAKGFIQRSC